MSLQEALENLRQTHVEHVFLPVLIQLAIIVLAARLCGQLFQWLGQSPVVGEIAAGIILGPSLLGRLPFVESIFHPQLAGVPAEMSEQVFRWIFTTLGQLGLVLVLFLVGLEFDFRHLRDRGRAAVWISVVGTIVPFGLGLALTPLFTGVLTDASGKPTSQAIWVFALFLGTALSITALPVLGRMLIEMKLNATRLGAVVITAAAAGDAVGWVLLAAVSAVSQSSFSAWAIARMFVYTLAFAGIVYWIARPLASWIVHRSSPADDRISVNAMALLIALLFACAIATSWIGIFSVIGAFFLGAVLSGETEFRHKVERQLTTFVTAFFLPVFFTYTGLRTRIQVLDSPELWLIFAVVMAAAVFGKVIGCGLAARFHGFSWRESAAVGSLMNTRGLMELIVANVGYDLGVLPESVFCMLVLMALLTTLMTTPLVRWFIPIANTNLSQLKSRI